MSHQQLILDLKTSRESAAKAINEVHIKITKCKDSTKNSSSISYNAVHAICMAIKDKADFFDIYAEAIEKVAVNILETNWNAFVEILRFILNEFYSKNLFQHAISLARFVTADRIATPADFKSHLKLISRHLLCTHPHLTQDQIKGTFKSLADIIVKSKEIQYQNLIEDLHTNVFNYSTMLQQVITKNLDKAALMIDKFFSVLVALKIDSSKLSDSFMLLTKYLMHFISIDTTDKNSVHSQNFLRSWRDNQSFRSHKYQSYVLNLFYYFIKLMLFPNTLDFNRNFAEIIDKFMIFFDRSELVKESWFMDTIVTMVRVLDSFVGQKEVLKSLDENNHKIAFTLFEKLIKLAHGVNYDSGLFTCCNSVRKHVIFMLCTIQMTLFENAVKCEYKAIELGVAVEKIFKHTIAVAEFFPCCTVSSEIAIILNILIRCSQNVKTKEHATLIVQMLLLTKKFKDHLPDNSSRTILKCLLHVQKVAENVQGQAEAYALYIAHLMETNMDTDVTRKYIGAFYSLEPCMSVCETLDESNSPWKSLNFNRRLLHSMETEVYAKSRGSNILVITSLLKSATNILHFVLVARQFPQVNVSKKLERKYAELRGNPSLSPLDHLALGHICKFRAVQQMDNIKNLFNIPKINDDTLLEISNRGQVKQVDVFAEMEILKIGIEAIEEFELIFDVASQIVLPEKDFAIDWEPIIDDVAMLARLFHFRGYIDFAYRSWRLLLRITTHIDDVLNQIRALGFMCDECQFVELYEPEFNLEQETTKMENRIHECLLNLEFLTPRRQNYVLICICSIGWYLATKGRFHESQILLDLVFFKVDELSERKGKFELVRATHLAITFRIKWKLLKEISGKMVFTCLDRILDKIRGVAYVTSEDTMNFPTLLFALVNDISEFTTNRLCEPATLPYVQMVLKLALDSGAAFRSVQLLILWTHINLQSEDASKCQVKLDLIDIFYRNMLSSNNVLTSSAISTTKHFLEVHPADTQLMYEEQAVRKSAYINSISPVRMIHTATTTHRDLESFLISHSSSCKCEKCTHTFFKWQSFKIGCLNARLLYLSDNYNESESFFAKALEWCSNQEHQTHTRFYFREYQFCMLIQFINVLRRTRKFNEAITTSKCAIEMYNQFKNALDGVYHLNLSLQLDSAVIEMNQKPITPKSPKVKRILKFSPIEASNSAEQVASTAAASSKRRGRPKKESPPTLKEDIEQIIYKHSEETSARASKLRARSVKHQKKPSSTSPAVDDICKIVDTINISDEVAATQKTTSRRRKANLNTAIIIVEDDDDSPAPTTSKCSIPKVAIKVVESTPLTRGRRPRKPPAAAVADVKLGELDARSKLLRRRI